MIKLIVIINLLILALAQPKTQPKTLFVQPKERRLHDVSAGLSIINGDEAKPHQFPYQVGIFIYTSSYSDFCGGSLISSNFVLTAAHCVEKADKVTLVFGAHNITSSESSQVRLSSNKFVIHEEWDNKVINKNDIALVKLPSPVFETSAIKIVSLANGSDKYANVIGSVAGWGMSKINQVGVTHILRYISPSTLSNEDCKNFDKDYKGIITDKLICISGDGKRGTCQGDSGGPLVVNNVQIGVVSFGAIDCEAGKPSVFTRVTKYKDWIAKNSDVSFH